MSKVRNRDGPIWRWAPAHQLVGEHAGPNAHADVRLSEEAGELRFEIVDDGVGCDIESARSAGAGLTNMSERVAALGGTLRVDSATGRGTQLRGRIPLAQGSGHLTRS
jgi:signal transduction histidine kinase